MAIQLAKAVGAHVAVTAGSQAKLDVCRELGAEILVNYREQDFVEELRERTGGAGADVILDNMGAKYLARNVDALATGGRLVTSACRAAARPSSTSGMLLRQAGRRHRHVAARPTGRGEGRHRRRRPRARLAADRVRPGAARRPLPLPARAAADAHRELEASAHIGKILLTT